MAERTCSIDGCGGAHEARGWCILHYSRWMRHGDPMGGRHGRGGNPRPPLPVIPLPDRGCWAVRLSNTDAVALVSALDVAFVQSHRWWVDLEGYCATATPDRGRMHRLLLDPPDHLVTDHVNGNRLDNRRENLRIVTQAANTQNLAVESARGYRGVYLDRRRGTWYGQVKHRGVKHDAGSGFATAEDAQVAVAALRRRLFPYDVRGQSAVPQRLNRKVGLR